MRFSFTFHTLALHSLFCAVFQFNFTSFGVLLPLMQIVVEKEKKNPGYRRENILSRSRLKSLKLQLELNDCVVKTGVKTCIHSTKMLCTCARLGVCVNGEVE